MVKVKEEAIPIVCNSGARMDAANEARDRDVCGMYVLDNCVADCCIGRKKDCV